MIRDQAGTPFGHRVSAIRGTVAPAAPATLEAAFASIEGAVEAIGRSDARRPSAIAT